MSNLRMSNWRVIVVVAIAGALIATGYVVQARKKPVAIVPKPTISSNDRAPEGAHVRVQVLNATKTHGLARRATSVLRDRGFDVVETGTTKQQRDTTIVYDLSGHDDWANRIARAFTPARVVARQDSSRYLDIAVVLGSTWRPPALPFYP